MTADVAHQDHQVVSSPDEILADIHRAKIAVVGGHLAIAIGMQKLRDQHGWSQARIAAETRCSQQTVSNHLLWLAIPETGRPDYGDHVRPALPGIPATSEDEWALADRHNRARDDSEIVADRLASELRAVMVAMYFSEYETNPAAFQVRWLTFVDAWNAAKREDRMAVGDRLLGDGWHDVYEGVKRLHDERFGRIDEWLPGLRREMSALGLAH